MKGICISHRPYLIKNPGLANKKREEGGWPRGIFHFHMLLALESASHSGGRYSIAAHGTNGCHQGNCSCIFDKTEEGGDRSYGLF